MEDGSVLHAQDTQTLEYASETCIHCTRKSYEQSECVLTAHVQTYVPQFEVLLHNEALLPRVYVPTYIHLFTHLNRDKALQSAVDKAFKYLSFGPTGGEDIVLKHVLWRARRLGGRCLKLSGVVVGWWLGCRLVCCIQLDED
jgi:hypothetical protein